MGILVSGLAVSSKDSLIHKVKHSIEFLGFSETSINKRREGESKESNNDELEVVHGGSGTTKRRREEERADTYRFVSVFERVG